MAISETIKRAVVSAAKVNGIEPAALLAVVEIESAGVLFEQDGRTPRLLFERHVFHRELAKRQPSKLSGAIANGLAIPKWSKATQYKDQGTSKERLSLIGRARAVDAECANRSASWGLGQTMGFNAEGLGFGSASDLVDYMQQGGIPAHVDCMVREIRRNKLEKKLAARDWAGFAKGYNGPGYAQNQYDTKLASAYRKWKAALDPNDPETGEEPVVIPPSRAAEPASSTSTKVWRAIGLGTGGVAAASQAVSVVTGPVTQTVSQVKEVIDAGGQVIDVTKQVVSIPPDGFWQLALAFVQSPKFLLAVLLAVVGAWGLTWWLRVRKEKQS